MNNILSETEELKTDPTLRGPRPMRESEASDELLTKIRGASGDVMREAVTFVKRYPLHTAIGAAAVGFLAGYLAKQGRK